MTDVIQAPGMGHNQPDPLEMEKKNQKWDRWAKKRTFVRALEGTYSHLYKTLKEEKRVYSAQDVAWKGGPQMFGKSVISQSNPTSRPTRPRPAARSMATSTAQCSTSSRVTATTFMTAARFHGRLAT
jgi:hypothetical protein